MTDLMLQSYQGKLTHHRTESSYTLGPFDPVAWQNSSRTRICPLWPVNIGQKHKSWVITKASYTRHCRSKNNETMTEVDRLIHTFLWFLAIFCPSRLSPASFPPASFQHNSALVPYHGLLFSYCCHDPSSKYTHSLPNNNSFTPCFILPRVVATSIDFGLPAERARLLDCLVTARNPFEKKFHAR